MFGLVLMTKKAHRAETVESGRLLAKAIMEADEKLRAVEADRDAADKQIERLLHNGLELTLLWAAVRDCTVEKQVRVVFNRMRPKQKGGKQ